MKKMDLLIAPLFSVVILMLSIGALGELVGSLFSKSKDSETEEALETEYTTEEAVQLK